MIVINPHVIIGSMQGRFYAMDRDHNWDRVEKSYRMLTEKSSHGTRMRHGKKFLSVITCTILLMNLFHQHN